VLRRIALGAGTKQLAWPNVARLWLGEMAGGGPIVQIETNIDDMNPQIVAAVCERLLAAGALDVWLSPVQMKKGRAAVVLCALCRSELEHALANLLLQETTTLGVRVHGVWRHEAQREFRMVQTEHGDVQVKLKILDGRIVGAMPEYDECKRLADARGLPLRIVHEAAQSAALKLLQNPPA
jgi:pyridinium-3,5-bisthiocarboxylic acid mononucleotide nickel chelatase